MMMFGITLLCVLGCLGLGHLFATLTGVHKLYVKEIGVKKYRFESWGVSIVAGVCLTSWLSFYHGALGFPLGPRLSWTLTFTGIIAWIICSFLLKAKPLPEVSPTASHKLTTSLSKICQITIGLLIILAFVYTLLTPQRFWDERSIFAIKSKVLFDAHSLWNEVLHHPDFVQYHPKYPLLIPLIEQHLYQLLDGVHDRLSKVFFPLLYAGLVLTFTGVCLRRFAAGWAWLSGLLMATVPVLMPYEYGFLSGQADAVMGCLHGLGVLYLWNAMQAVDRKERGTSRVLAAFFIASAAFSKDEGIAFFLVDLIAWSMAFALGSRSLTQLSSIPSRWSCLFKQGAAWVCLTVLILLPWFWYRRTLPSTGEMNYFERMTLPLMVERLETLKWSVPHLFHRMFLEWKSWGLQWWLVVTALLTTPCKAITVPQLFLLLNLMGTLAALLVAGMVAPAELEEHLGGSTHRYLMQIAPVGILFIASQWAQQKDS